MHGAGSTARPGGRLLQPFGSQDGWGRPALVPSAVGLSPECGSTSGGGWAWSSGAGRPRPGPSSKALSGALKWWRLEGGPGWLRQRAFPVLSARPVPHSPVVSDSLGDPTCFAAVKHLANGAPRAVGLCVLRSKSPAPPVPAPWLHFWGLVECFLMPPLSEIIFLGGGLLPFLGPHSRHMDVIRRGV